jgi:hypothetical protein
MYGFLKSGLGHIRSGCLGEKTMIAKIATLIDGVSQAVAGADQRAAALPLAFGPKMAAQPFGGAALSLLTSRRIN